MCVRSKIFGLHVGQHFFPFILFRNLATFRNKRAYGSWLAHLNPCQEERMFTIKYKSHSPTLKSIIVSSIKFRKGFAKFMIPIALLKKFLRYQFIASDNTLKRKTIQALVKTCNLPQTRSK